MKTDLEITRRITINTGNYSSINPSVSIILKDINLSDIATVREDIDPIINDLFNLEILDLYTKQASTAGLNVKAIASKAPERKESILENLKDLVNKLDKE